MVVPCSSASPSQRGCNQPRLQSNSVALLRGVSLQHCARIILNRYVALVEQPGPNPTATTFVDCGMADVSAVAHNSFSELAASERKVTQESFTSQRGERFKDPA